MTFTIKSKDFVNGELIPSQFTCDDQDISPELEWYNIPVGTKSFTLIMDDPDAPVGMWDHWILFNIPLEITKLESNIQKLPRGVKAGKNSWGRTDYGGPCPPDREHRYFFKLYALDTILDLEEGITKKELEKAMGAHIIAKTEIIGRYDRIKK